MAGKPHDPAKAVESDAEAKQLVLAGLASGEPTPMTEADWELLRQRALANAEIRKLGEATA